MYLFPGKFLVNYLILFTYYCFIHNSSLEEKPIFLLVTLDS